MESKIYLENNNDEEFSNIDEEFSNIDEESFDDSEEIFDKDAMNTTYDMTDIEMKNYKFCKSNKCESYLNTYITSIMKYRVLEKNEEAELFKMIHEGIKEKHQLETNDYKNNDIQSDETIKTLLKLQDIMHKGEVAKQKIVNHNLRLVISIAKFYKSNKYDFFDLIQEGNIALIKAVDKFDTTMEYKFSTYAYTCIKLNIIRYLNNTACTIRIPAYLMEKIFYIKRTFKQLTYEFGREPSSKEVGQRLGIDGEEVDRLLTLVSDLISIDYEVSFDDDTEQEKYKYEINTILEDKTQASADDIIISKEMHNDIMKILNSNDIKHRDRDIIIDRFGLDGSDGKTLAEIGDKYGLTREGVRQIENRVLEKLRRHKHRKIIEDYIN